MARERFKLDEGDGQAMATGGLLRRLFALIWRHRWAAVPAIGATVLTLVLVLAGAAVQGLAIDVMQARVFERGEQRGFFGELSDWLSGAPRHGEAPDAGEMALRVLSPATGMLLDASERAAGALETGFSAGGEAAAMNQVDWIWGIEPPGSWSTLAITGVLGGLIVVIAVLGGVGRFCERVADEFYAQACVVDLRTRLYAKLQSLGFTFFDDHDTGQIIQRVTQDVQYIRMFLQGVVIRTLISLVMLTGFLVYMLSQSVVLTLACLLTIPVQVTAVIVYGRIAKPRFKHHSSLVDKVVQFYKESIEGVKVIRVFGKQRAMAGVFEGKSGEARDYRIGLSTLMARTIPLLMSGQILNQAVLLGVGGWLVVRNVESAGAVGITLGTLWEFYLLMGRFGGQVEAIAMVGAQAPTALAGADRAFRLLEADPDVASPAEARREPIRGRVVFEGVSFGYVPGVMALQDISFDAGAGETIAIVGPTGSGKSTLLNLIGRFYDPDSGRVLIDGRDVRSMDLALLRRRVGFVFQEPFLFSNTVRSNVAFGVPEVDLDAVREASVAAAASEFVEQLDQGFDTVIGERGVTLSGGQRQRLALARALVLRPSILVLDDATGAVDAVTEAQIQEHLERYLGERTTFVVAHRLSTLRRADRIIVLEGGRIAAVGTHDELMAQRGHYRDAAQIQLEDETVATGTGSA